MDLVFFGHDFLPIFVGIKLEAPRGHFLNTFSYWRDRKYLRLNILTYKQETSISLMTLGKNCFFYEVLALDKQLVVTSISAYATIDKRIKIAYDTIDIKHLNTYTSRNLAPTACDATSPTR
jgi:hypothetical protein